MKFARDMEEIFAEGLFLKTLSAVLAEYWKGTLPRKDKSKGVKMVLAKACKDIFRDKDGRLKKGEEEFINKTLGLMLSFLLGFKNIYLWKKTVEIVLVSSYAQGITPLEFLDDPDVLVKIEKRVKEK